MSYSLYTGEVDGVQTLEFLHTFSEDGLKAILKDMMEKFGDDFLTYLGFSLRTHIVITDVDAFTGFLMSKYIYNISNQNIAQNHYNNCFYAKLI